MYSAFIDSNAITPIFATFPALFAKSSLVWPAGVNLFVLKYKNERYQKLVRFNLTAIVAHRTNVTKL
jgi:hypothetical protein